MNERLGPNVGGATKHLALVTVLTGLLVALLGFLAPAASASTLLRPQTRVAAIEQPNRQFVGPSSSVLAVQGRERAPNYDQHATGSSVAAEDGAAGAGDAQYVYRVHGGDSGQWGHSWTPENPLEMENPRAELGLPKVNSGQYLTKAQVLDAEGVITRDALPLDGNPGGDPEWLFPDPASQLQEVWTLRLQEPF